MKRLAANPTNRTGKSHRWVVVPCLVLIFIIGFHLRIVGYRWGIDDGQYYHPDERGIFMQANKIRPLPVAREEGESFWQYAYRWLDTNLSRSRTNDHETCLEPVGFNYGSFPWYLLNISRSCVLHFAGQEVPVSRWSMYDDGRIGRSISALLGALTLLVIYCFGARFYNWKVGLLAAFLLMITVTHIQLCHFYCFDPIQAFFILLALYFMARVADSGRLPWYLFSALFIGLSLATKFSSLPIIAVLPLAHLLLVFSRRPQAVLPSQQDRFWVVLVIVTIPLTLIFLTLVGISHLSWVQDHGWLLWIAVTLRLLAGIVWFIAVCYQIHLWNRGMRWASVINPWVYFLLALWFTSRFSFVFQPFAFISPEAFWKDINGQRTMATHLDSMPFTIQYRQTYAYFYHLATMFHRTLGYPLAVSCFAGVVYLVWRQFRKADKTSILLVAWVLGYFLVVGRFNVKFPRYMIPIIPPLVLIGAKFLVDLLNGELVRTLIRKGLQTGRDLARDPSPWMRRVRLAGAALFAVTVVYTWAYAFAFVRIYKENHTWKEASYWIYEHVPKGSSFVWERWGDPLPMTYHQDPQHPPVDPGMFRYRRDEVFWYSTDSPEKIATNMRKVSQADYVVLCSKRAYGSTMKAPERFPYTSNYYKMLFTGQLGFDLVKVVERPIRFLGLTLYDDLIDESFRLYDHPKVCIFKKVRKLDAPTLTQLVLQPPEWIEKLTHQEILTVHDGEAVFQQKPSHPVFSWYLSLFALGLIAFPFLFLICPNLADRGYAFAKTLGILVLGYFAWLLPSLSVVTFSGTEIALVLTVMAGAALYAYFRQRKQMGVFLEAHLGDLILTEIVFLLVFFVFTRIRMWNPDIHWGEKPMDFSMLTAVYRAEWFPPEDPWIAGKPINYYYYGFVLLGVLGKMARVPPEYCFNLALGTIPALVFVSAYGIVRTLTRSRLYGFFSGYLLCFAGSLAGFIHPFYIPELNEGQHPFLNFHNSWSMARLSSETTPWWDRLIDGIAGGRIGEALHWVGDFIRLLLLPFKIVWLWLTGGQVPRYPELGFDEYFWDTTRLIKSTVANEFPYWTFMFADLHAHMIVIPFTVLFVGLCTNALLSPRAGLRVWGSGWGLLIGFFVPCLALGSVLCINSWSFPTLTFLLVLVLCYRGWHFRSAGTVRNLRRPLRMARSLGIAGHLAKRSFLWVYGVMLELALPLLTIVIAAIMLYIPFHNRFYPRVALGRESINFMRSGWTTPPQFFFVFGLFAFIALVYLLVKLRDLSITVGGRRRWWPWLAFAAVVLVVLLGAQLITWYFEPSPTDNIRIHSGKDALYHAPYKVVGHNRASWVYRGDIEAVRRAQRGEEPPIERETSQRPGGLWNSLAAYVKNLLLGKREGPYYALASLLLPWLLLIIFLLLRRKHPPEEHVFLVFLAVALSVLVGAEVFYIFEEWAEPSHRWNTVFKFYMHVWIFFSLAAPGALYFFRRRTRPLVSGCLWDTITTYTRASVYTVITVMFLMTFAFTVFAAYTVTAKPTPSIAARCVRSEERPTVDGLSFWKARAVDPSGDMYRSFHWLRRFIDGTPTMVEGDCQTEPGTTYGNTYPAAPASTYTGIPALVGWTHHAKERGPGPFLTQHKSEMEQRRLQDQKAVFRSSDKRRVLDLLRRWQVDLVYIGLLERRKYPGIREKFDSYGDVLDLLYESENVSIFRTRPNLNFAFLGEVEEEEEVVAPVASSGENVFKAGQGSDYGYLKDPHGLTVDPQGRIVVADTHNHRIQVFDATGDFVLALGEQGALDEDFQEPHDVATDSEGNIYVADTWNSRLKKYSPEGKLIHIVGERRGPLFYGPRAIAVDSAAGRVYVADTGHHNCQVFDLQLRRILSIGGRGEEEGKLHEPTGIAVGPDGEIVIAEMLNARVSIFDRTGGFLRVLRPPLGSDNSGNEMHVAVSKQGHVYVTDPRGSRIFHYTLDGELVDIINTPNRPNFRVLKPMGIAIDREGRLLVADREQHLVVRSPQPYP